MAILNQRDYRLAKALVGQLEKARASGGLLGESAAGLPADVIEARRTALKQEYERLLDQIREYEKLRGQVAPTGKLEGADLGLLPIFARITRGWSQRQLAEALNLKEQQIQRYEREKYASASLARYRSVIETLGVEISASFVEEALKTTLEKPVLGAFEISPVVLKEIQRRSWIERAGVSNRADLVASLREYVSEGVNLAKTKALHRRQLRENSQTDDVALLLWQSRVLKLANQFVSKARKPFSISDASWIKELVALSVFPDGPLRAISFLREKGVTVVIEAHLPQTHLDGAAMLLSNGYPVIGLTLRYDRLDSFWFTLLHELGHILLHFNRGLDVGFFDNMDADVGADVESEADSFARSALIADELWRFAPVRFTKSAEAIKSFAASHGMHAAIVAGRIRQERNDYSKFSSLVGQGEVRKLFQ